MIENKPIYALVIAAQALAITAHCFGDCGKAAVYGMFDEDLGTLIAGRCICESS